MIADIHQKLQELVDYRESPAINQSRLKRAIGTAASKEETANMQTGSLIDCLLFTPELFDHLFFIQRESYNPSVEKIADIIVERIYNMDEREYAETWDAGGDAGDAIILEACEQINYQRTWGDHTKLAKLKNPEDLNLLQCVDDKLSAHGKTTITREEKEEGQAIARRAKVFIYSIYAQQINEGWTAHSQLPCYFTYRNKDCKGLLDLCWMSPDSVNREIIPVDFKYTSFSLRSAHYQLRKMRTDMQAAFYTEGLQQMHPNAFIHKFEIIMYSAADDAFERITLSDQDILIGKYGMKRIEEWPVNGEQHIVRQRSVLGFDEAFNFLDIDDPATYRQMIGANNNSIWF